jgi:5'-deoxynucleotidase YfbR-like HD superfamily hydrolase
MANRQEIRNDAGELVGIRSTNLGIVEARRGKYMHTSNGKKYWPMDPRPEEVHIEVVAHHLATRCRYNGAVQHPIFRSRIFYSVAEHSVLVSRYIEEVLRKPEYALEGLLHDGSEAYNGDLIRPLKYDPIFREPFKVVEELNEAAGASRFALVYPYPQEVKIADEAVTNAEIAQIVPKDPNEDFTTGKLHDDSRMAPYEIVMLDPFAAKEQFLMRFEELMRKRDRFNPVASHAA